MANSSVISQPTISVPAEINFGKNLEGLLRELDVKKGGKISPTILENETTEMGIRITKQAWENYYKGFALPEDSTLEKIKKYLKKKFEKKIPPRVPPFNPDDLTRWAGRTPMIEKDLYDKTKGQLIVAKRILDEIAKLLSQGGLSIEQVKANPNLKPLAREIENREKLMYRTLSDMCVINISAIGKSEITTNELIVSYKHAREDFFSVVNPKTLGCSKQYINAQIWNSLNSFEKENPARMLIDALLNRLKDIDMIDDDDLYD